jgi:predicted transcriptional regulator
MAFVFDPSEQGLRKVMRDYQELALRYLWDEKRDGATSKMVWDHVNDNLGGRTISRASVIFFLDRIVEEGVLGYRDESGKGGYHRVYTPRMSELEYRKYLVRTIVESMKRDFPGETEEVLREFIG